MKIELKSENQDLKLRLPMGISLSLKREDLIHPQISGNKARKLKYNLLAAKKAQKKTLLTFGGAFSNHIAATATAGADAGFKTIGIIRGEELVSKISENPTLTYAQNCGMTFKFITRAAYKNKNDQAFIKALMEEFDDFYLLPEGGTNALAVKGCEEILTEADKMYDYICVAAGTGGTAAGLINTAAKHQQILVFSALKGDFLEAEIAQLCKPDKSFKFIGETHFGGYGKIKPGLITFINQFKESTQVQLEPLYTGKMLFGIFELINKGYFKQNTKILAIHTGGIQGIKGINIKLQQQGLPLINLK